MRSAMGGTMLVKVEAGVVDDTIRFVDQSSDWKKIGENDKDISKKENVKTGTTKRRMTKGKRQ
uniref:Uncharacterized protein n=1 Tax=Romanomermis culicivorax TaxID=13658 RepID=A0A915J2G5_ROMCU